MLAAPPGPTCVSDTRMSIVLFLAHCARIRLVCGILMAVRLERSSMPVLFSDWMVVGLAHVAPESPEVENCTLSAVEFPIQNAYRTLFTASIVMAGNESSPTLTRLDRRQ